MVFYGSRDNLAEVFPFGSLDTCTGVAKNNRMPLMAYNLHLVCADYMMNKRETVARLAGAVGLTHLLQYASREPRLVVLNYHRIGDPETCSYDPALFSTTASQFDDQIAFYKRHFNLVTLPEALDIVESNRRESGLLITFDDGYLDNYELAFPILRAHGASATFFLASGFIATDRLPWWDTIAFMLRQSRTPHIQISYPISLTVDTRYFRVALRSLLRAYKLPIMKDPPRFLAQIEDITGVKAPSTVPKPVFMNWEQASEMAFGGMHLGSHTHRHEILASLTLEEQIDELVRSRDLIRANTGVEVHTLAYPVGNPNAFSPETFTALERAGYRAAFSFYGGVNPPKSTNRYDIKRFPVDFGNSLEMIHWRVALSMATTRAA